MKNCAYCAEAIQDSARKCRFCQSYQSPADEPKKGLELATLVISFVGVIAVIGTIVAAVFGWLGFRAIGDTQQINQRSQSVLDSSQQTIKTFSDKISLLQSTVDDLNKKADSAKGELNAVTISRHYDDFEQTIDYIQLDSAYNFDKEIEHLHSLSDESSRVAPIPDEAKANISEMISLSKAIGQYRNAIKDNDKEEFLDVITTLRPLTQESVAKNRILTGSYSHLYQFAVDQTQPNEASDYLLKEKYYSEKAFRLAQSSNKSYITTKVNYAASLVETGRPQEMRRGYDLLVEARKESPQNFAISYNIGVYFAKTKDFDKALNCLEQTKVLGEFSSSDDIQAWLHDHDFDLLRQMNTDDQKQRIQKLLTIGAPFRADSVHCP